MPVNLALSSDDRDPPFSTVYCFRCGDPTPAPPNPDPQWMCYDCRKANPERSPFQLDADAFNAQVLDANNALDALNREAQNAVDVLERKLTDTRMNLRLCQTRIEQIIAETLKARADLSHATPTEDVDDQPF